MLSLPQHWLWDFWLAVDGSDYHLFFLKAPRALGDPNLRHWHPTIGHAISQDLKEWLTLPDALVPSSPSSGEWDNFTVWTGSVIKHENLWYMFYTGCNRKEQGKIQRIGLATSKDLIHWSKHPSNPLIEADPLWYEKYDEKNPIWPEEAWRDPWVFYHPGTNNFHIFITARSCEGLSDERGVIGHAESRDLIHWQVLPPVSAPGNFSQLEVPQLLQINSKNYLLFSTETNTLASDGEKTRGRKISGTHYLISDNMLGPFELKTPIFFAGDVNNQIYAGKILKNPQGKLVFLTWKNLNKEGNFLGELSDPYPVRILETGELSIQIK